MGAEQPRAKTRLGEYEILRKLARGGMAELFLARTTGPEGFAKLVVVKRILPTYADNPRFVQLFLDEARLASTLDHPHIARVYDSGNADGQYFAMEYVHGQDLRATMRRTARSGRQLPIGHAVQIGRDIASALHYAHERRNAEGVLLDLVHRDVSPSNVLLGYDGAVKLVDFGVAKAATSTVKTRTGTLKGKISYMSPEQARGSPIDRRSDVFALGVVLWEMVTTQRLFKAENDLATIQLIINSQAPRPSELRAECSPALESIVLRALSTDLAERYQTAEEVQLDLEELAREHEIDLTPGVLRAHMHDLFEDEIRSWEAAQASGVTLMEHVVSSSVVELTLGSEDEIELVEDEPEHEEDDELVTSRQLLHEQVTSIMPERNPPVPDEPDEPEDPPTLDAPRPSSEPAMEPPTIPRVPTPSGMVRLQTADPSFPIAPKEWRRPVELRATEASVREAKLKRILIGSACAFAALVILSLAFGDSGSTTREEPADIIVPMRAQPPPDAAR